MTDASIAAFLAMLETVEAPPNSIAPWSAESDVSGVRRRNLALYLHDLKRRRTRTMLLAEAAARLTSQSTGVPFTSEHILVHGVASLDMFGEERGYRRPSQEARLRRSPSATIVWETLARFDFLPLLWSAFPFQPHPPGNPGMIRTPTTAEIAYGRPIWQQLVEVMEIEEIVAVGNIAHRSLASAGIDAPRIRHPSQGGKADFVEGIRSLAERNRPCATSADTPPFRP
jgi:uracil-DNA glycosylase